MMHFVSVFSLILIFLGSFAGVPSVLASPCGYACYGGYYDGGLGYGGGLYTDGSTLWAPTGYGYGYPSYGFYKRNLDAPSPPPPQGSQNVGQATTTNLGRR